jgi:O-acetyl-ADP-ribose deacetylase (regulator of RNase III)
MKQVSIKNTNIRIIKGDLTESDVDVIVNAANSHLQHGGGVAGAIVRKGGRIIQEESNKIGFVPVGNCAITTGGSLKALFVIHTVGPQWGEGQEEEKLKNAIRNTLALATEKGFNTLSMPAISAGIFGFPKESCANIIVNEMVTFIRNESTPLREINLYLMDEEIVGFFEQELIKLEKGK